jgi:hypothetical protein
MCASNRNVALYSTDQRMRLQAPNMDIGQHLSSGLFEVSVGQRQLVSLFLQVLVQHVRDGHGAMTATGTAEGDGEIGFALALIVG